MLGIVRDFATCATCLPGLLPLANPFAQSLGNIDVTKPLLIKASLEDPASFTFYTGSGSRVQGFRQPGYSDFDIGLQELVHIRERVTFHLRGDAFNVLNAHHFNTVGISLHGGSVGGGAFDTDVASAGFGTRNGAVATPRNIQVSGSFVLAELGHLQYRAVAPYHRCDGAWPYERF